MRMAARLEAMGRRHYFGTTKKVKGRAVWTGLINVAPDDTLMKPLRWRTPRTVFVNSMSDLFHEDVPDAMIDKVFAVMALAPQHTFQVLTKRAERMAKYMVSRSRDDRFLDNRIIGAALRILRGRNDIRYVSWDLPGWPLPNVWLGVSAERQKEADERIPHLLQTPTAVRFVSAEPLLGPIDLSAWPNRVWLRTIGHDGAATRPGLDWIIVGGESGPHARPMKTAWAESVRDQCRSAGVAFFMKQMAKKAPIPGHLFIREMPNRAA